MKLWFLLILGAISPFLFSSALSVKSALFLLLITAVIALLIPRLRVYCLLPVFFVYTTFAINERLADRLPLSESPTLLIISGTVSSLPVVEEDRISFLFEPDEVSGAIPSQLRVNWYRDRRKSGSEPPGLPDVRAGEHWRLHLQLRSPRGRVNFHGMDAERWHFTEGIGALANVQKGVNVRLAAADWFDLQHRRERLLEKLKARAGDVPMFRMLAALAIADRRDLQASDRKTMSATGTGHLLAISGLHIGLAAAMGFYLGRFFLLFVGYYARQSFAIALPWVSAWFAALAYAALSGFGVSTQRALIMLSVACLVSLYRRNVHPFLAWLIAMGLVLLVDPFAPLRAGFWFSFLAVAVLIMLFVPRHGPMSKWKKLLLAQLGISIVMAPLGMYWFQQTSLPGLLANIFAIPTVSLLVVPLVLVSLVLLDLPGPLAEWTIQLAAQVSDWLFRVLEFLAQLQPVAMTATSTPHLFSVIVAMIGGAIFLLPRVAISRYLGLLLMLPLMMPGVKKLKAKEARIDFLDVGQGLAVLVSDKDSLMVYDTGPGNGLASEQGWDMVTADIQPMIQATGLSPSHIVISHADLDHAGGRRGLQRLYPDSRYLGSFPVRMPGFTDCRTPNHWEMGMFTFDVLHPAPGLPYLGNDSSCVVSVIAPGLSLLLSGDISDVVEQRLVNSGITHHDVLTVPHHGSSTSSSSEFIEQISPSYALISSGYKNRFGFPREDVLQRYSDAGVFTLNTGGCGGLRITGNSTKGFMIQSARKQRKALWRLPALGNCPG